MIRRNFWSFIGVAATAAAAMAASKRKAAKQFLNPTPAKPPGYTHCVTSPPGKMVFLSGQGGTGEDGKMPPDFATQAHNTFKHLERCLKLGGATFKDVVKINYYVTDMKYTGELRQVRAQYLNMDAPPAATLVQTGLGAGLLLEVECTAIIPEA